MAEPQVKKVVQKGGKKSAANVESNVKAIPVVGAVVAKYTENGWNVYSCIEGNLNDLIAFKDKKLHFVQVVSPDTRGDPRHIDIARNTFIQNAFSNNAVPIFACTQKKSNAIAVTFEDINTGSRVIVGGKSSKAGPVL